MKKGWKILPLIEQVRQICNRLAVHGWRDLFLQHGIDITAADLKQELLKDIQAKINRKLKGFEDFSLEGTRGIEPGHPARSLFYHSLASPNVVTGVDGLELTSFPTLRELEIVENYVYGITPPSLSEIRSRVGRNEDLAIVVFASEYRPAPETVHRKHADLSFSRTGVARVGTTEPLYSPKNRGFLPNVKDDDFAFRVLPARYSVYIAVQRKGNENEFGPISRSEEQRKGDMRRLFWIPLHKLFSGTECISEFNINVSLEAHHVNEKLRRIHLELGKDAGWSEPHISQSPFFFKEGIAKLSDSPEFGTNVLVPVPHPLIEVAQYEGKTLTFKVPKNPKLFSSSLKISAVNGARRAPEYVHIRHKMKNGKIIDLNEKSSLMEEIKEGGYDAVHYIDYTADGWIKAICPELAFAFLSNHPAYSLVTALDFFPHCDQREVMDWWHQSVPKALRGEIWQRGGPTALSYTRRAANLELKTEALIGSNTIKKTVFNSQDDTMTAIVSLPYKIPPQDTKYGKVPETTRHSSLPDAAAGVFAPGWDVSFDRTQEGTGGESVKFLAAYGLGSPFPEDTKLCAALSTFWPAVAPDAARTFGPNLNQTRFYPTVSPLTDEEIGQAGNLPWDGVSGPQHKEGQKVIEYTSFDYVDYVNNALYKSFSLSLTSRIDIREYQARLSTMAHVYAALGIAHDEKSNWGVLSFREVDLSDKELQTAQESTHLLIFPAATPRGTVYRFEMYLRGKTSPAGNDFRKVHVKINEKVILFVNGVKILIKREGSDWIVQNVNF
ncbi:hypothetical protein C7437_10454 [Psychrobacillus insolitus]|uniref:Uncharacterized protein n=1 Tax=Psychrobacillus insolitus TaxID=1461 RepID=A0A2W7N532_9BACI|nr:hypothetical protein [Psychrobacillus insolitus]PZX04542.1 hypothetical protein C7437_10454 [Psychrobacillus insolitus]